MDKRTTWGVVALIVFLVAVGVGYVYMNSGSSGGSSGSGSHCYTRTQYVPEEKPIINSQFIVEARNYRYQTFIVQDNWFNPSLEINIKIYQGSDIKLILLKDNKIIWQSGKVGPAYTTTINLPGTGSYEIRIDNTYSIITNKNVEARVVLHYELAQPVETCS
ncbi:MAG: hypothetical protein F7B59_08290 [Desulfurococcales archaeon]|nr:hypothetical protein [Desulfurococcales archaeon]